MFIPLAVLTVLIVGGFVFFRHRKRREKLGLDEKEEAIRARDAQNDLPNEGN